MKKLIVSRYNENIDWVNKINFDYIIYNKGINDLYQPHINLKNVGREADTYLNYIILNYHKLPEIVVFSQGNPFDHCYDFIEKVNKTTDINNVTWLGSNWGPITKNYDGGPGSDPLPLIELCELLFYQKYDISKTFTFSAGAQYMVPHKFITNKSLDWWKLCYSVFDKYIEISPWAYERIWPMIWNYSTNH